MNYTTTKLLRRGYDSAPFERAFAACFTNASTATTGTVQNFWNHFIDAHRKIYRGGAERMAA